ncbi:hypothetical protein GQX73_g2352 [Xylaria multiplex]|uniref:Uncharacterized protein n=1 Tax=Xylaria multiplex TaxID=323545 RepID=A0A7C8N227_9PEZI|nr:hypothetical protein GQX73_g2352 [Xylaria multiplex]
MSPGVSFSTASLGRLVDDGASDSDDYSSISEDLHIGASSRPQLPLILSNNSISKSLPSRWPGSIVSRGVAPSYRSQSARPHQACDYHQRASSYSPRPQPHPPSPLPPRPPPPPPPPPLTRPVSGTILRPLDRHDGWRGNLAEPQNGYDDRSHGNDRDGFFSSSWHENNGPEVKAKEQSDYARHLTENYFGLQRQRSVLLDSLDKAKSQGAYIRKLQQSEDEVSRKFMAAIRALLPDGTELDQLQQLFKALQDIRLKCQEAGHRFEETVDELYQGQVDLGSREEAFCRTVTGVSGIALLNLNNERDGHSDNGKDWFLRGITADRSGTLHQLLVNRSETLHPLYEKLRMAFAELQLAKELLVNTQMKREALYSRKSQPLAEDSLILLETYGDAGKKKALELRATALITEEDTEQLQQYDKLEREANEDIKIYTEMVRTLEQECKENDILLSSFQSVVDSFYQDEIILTPDPFESHDESTTLAHPIFPHLLSNPTHLLHDFPQTALQSLRMALQLPLDAPVRAKQVKEAAHEANMHSLLSTAESEDKSEYINRWLLHKLHNSALEAELLWSTFRSRMKILDVDRWQRDVLNFWWRDKPTNVTSVDIGDNETNKAVGSNAKFNMISISRSDSGQLDGLRNWNLDDSWL